MNNKMIYFSLCYFNTAFLYLQGLQHPVIKPVNNEPLCEEVVGLKDLQKN